MKTSKTSNLRENFKNLRKLQAQDLAVSADQRSSRGGQN